MPATVRTLLRTGAIGAVALAVALTAACTSQTKLRHAELDQLTALFPGLYDNHLQIEAERAQGRIVHESVTLAVVPIYAPMLSDAVFYLHENATDDVRRVLSQRLAAFMTTPDGRIIEKTYTFAEPNRWRAGVDSTDLFKSMVPQDLHEMTGCALTWTKTGDRFTGTNDPATCRTPALGSGALLGVRSSAELTSEELDLDQRVIGANGEETAAVPADFRFRRRADRAP